MMNYYLLLMTHSTMKQNEAERVHNDIYDDFKLKKPLVSIQKYFSVVRVNMSLPLFMYNNI